MDKYKKDEVIKGTVMDIQRFCIHDGPGVRTTVFLQGCPLRCLWCHNPESNSLRPVLSFMPGKCINCGNCVKYCPYGIHRIADGEHIINREKCTGCGICARMCFAGALQLMGAEMTVADVMNEVMRDKKYYDLSGGGVTISGGEPFMQYRFTLALLKDAAAKGLHTAIETSGYTSFKHLENTIEYTNLYLYDYKEIDPLKHVEYTGVTNGIIIENLYKLNSAGAKIILRCPIIPGLNDRSDHFESIAAHASKLENLAGVEIMPYHRLGVSKRNRFGLDRNKHPEFISPDKTTVEEWSARLEALGVRLIQEKEG